MDSVIVDLGTLGKSTFLVATASEASSGSRYASLGDSPPSMGKITKTIPIPMSKATATIETIITQVERLIPLDSTKSSKFVSSSSGKRCADKDERGSFDGSRAGEDVGSGGGPLVARPEGRFAGNASRGVAKGNSGGGANSLDIVVKEGCSFPPSERSAACTVCHSGEL